MGIFQKAKEKVIDATASAIAYNTMGGRKYKRMAVQAENDIKLLKEDRASGGNPIEPDPTSKQWQTRSLANDVRFRRDPKKLGMK